MIASLIREPFNHKRRISQAAFHYQNGGEILAKRQKKPEKFNGQNGDIKAEGSGLPPASQAGRQSARVNWLTKEENSESESKSEPSPVVRRAEETISLIKTSIMRNNLTASLATATIPRRHSRFRLWLSGRDGMESSGVAWRGWPRGNCCR